MSPRDNPRGSALWNGAALTTTAQPASFATNRIEQILIFATVTLMPLQEAIPTIAGFSIVSVLFLAQAGYVFVKRLECVARVWTQPLFITVYLYVFLTYLVEFSKSYSLYGENFQVTQVAVGAVILAALCRDRAALRMAMYGALLAGLFCATNLLFNVYGALSGAVVTSYREADIIRESVFESKPLQSNLNTLAFITAQATGVGLALGLTTPAGKWRNLFFAVTLACFVATFLPMSRGGILTILALCAYVMFSRGLGPAKALTVGVFVVAAILFLVPEAVWQRVAFTTEADEFGRQEGRAAIYSAFFNHFHEFALTGVGYAVYWNWWALTTGYSDARGNIVGAHNLFFQTMIYWGLPGLLGLLSVVIQSFRCLPVRANHEGLAISLRVIALSLLLWAFQMHALEKVFAVGIGLFGGARAWIWPELPTSYYSSRKARRQRSTQAVARGHRHAPRW